MSGLDAWTFLKENIEKETEKHVKSRNQASLDDQEHLEAHREEKETLEMVF
jgi:hypothetical protein